MERYNNTLEALTLFDHVLIETHFTQSRASQKDKLEVSS